MMIIDSEYDDYCIEATGDVTICNVKTSIDSDHDKGVHSEGDVLIVGRSFIQAISANTITIGYLHRLDHVRSNGYTGTVKIRDGQTFYYDDDYGRHYVSGTLTSEEVTTITNRYIIPSCEYVSLEVEGYGEGNDKWVFIASPVVGSILPEDVNNLIGLFLDTTIFAASS